GGDAVALVAGAGGAELVGARADVVTHVAQLGVPVGLVGNAVVVTEADRRLGVVDVDQDRVAIDVDKTEIDIAFTDAAVAGQAVEVVADIGFTLEVVAVQGLVEHVRVRVADFGEQM